MASAPSPSRGAPVFVVDLPHINGQVETWIDADARIDELEKAKSAAAAEIIRHAAPARIDLCRNLGKVVPTVQVNGRLNVTQTSRYGIIAGEALPRLNEAFGDDAAAYFSPSLKIALTDEAAADPQILEALLHALGPERFRKSFTVTRLISVSERFHVESTLIDRIAQRAAPFIADNTLRPYKPTLRAP